MTKKQRNLYKITASLLNSWNYIFDCNPDYSKEAFDSFVKTLNRIKEPPNFYMKRGIEFEEKCCYSNEHPLITNIIEGGAFQVYAEKDLCVDGMDIKLLGYLDVLKAGVIYDIKRVNKYDTQKYFTSYQHHVYFALVPESNKFVYLIGAGNYDNALEYYTETYYREEALDIVTVIETFFNWLKENNLFEVYKEYWKIEDKGELL